MRSSLEAPKLLLRRGGFAIFAERPSGLHPALLDFSISPVGSLRALTPGAGRCVRSDETNMLGIPMSFKKARRELGAFARDMHGPGYRTCSRRRRDNQAEQVFGERNRHAI